MNKNKIYITGMEEAPFNTLSYQRINDTGWVEQAELPFIKVFVNHLPDELDAIVTCADLQGRWKDGALIGCIVAEELQVLSRMGELPAAEKTGVLLCGDFYARENLDRRGGMGNVSDVWHSFASRFRWCIGVAGNHDIFSAMPDNKAFKKFQNEEGINFLDASCIETDKLKICGISGIIGNPKKVFRRSEAEFSHDLQKLLQQNPDLLLLHDGPDYPEENLDGNPIIRTALNSRNHVLVIRGHKHWEHIYIRLNQQIQVINTYEKVLVLLRDSINTSNSPP